MMKVLRNVALTLSLLAPIGFVAVPAMSVPAAAATIDDYKATAAKWLPMLPPAPKGWKRTKPETFVSNSAFQKAMEVRSIYHNNDGPGQIGVFIGAKPGFKPDFRRAMFDDEATAKKKGYAHKTIDGRKWLVRKKGNNLSYVTLLGRGIVVVLAGKWAEAAQVEAMLPKFDYKAIAAVK